MKIKFLRDYRGWATGEHFYAAGEVVELRSQVNYLIEQGVVEEVKPPAPKKRTTKKAAPKPKAEPKAVTDEGD